MFNFINNHRPSHRLDILSMDFGTLCFLYPSESGPYVGFRSTGIMDKAIDMIKSVIQKKTNAELAYYKSETDSFF